MYENRAWDYLLQKKNSLNENLTKESNDIFCNTSDQFPLVQVLLVLSQK